MPSTQTQRTKSRKNLEQQEVEYTKNEDGEEQTGK